MLSSRPTYRDACTNLGKVGLPPEVSEAYGENTGMVDIPLLRKREHARPSWLARRRIPSQ